MPTISVITPTFHREDLLARCVKSVLAQEVDADVQHLVVNDYGQPLAPADWMADPRVTVLNTYRTERSNARNAGATLSRGDWLYFLDDDDYVLPGGFAAMLAAAGADPHYVCAGYRVVNGRTGEALTHRFRLQGDVAPMLIAGEGLPLQATWVRRDVFFTVGCFDPLYTPGEDADLLRRVSLSGPMVTADAVVAEVLVESPDTTTTNYARHMEFWWRGLEKVFSLPGTLPQLLARTDGEPYWRGRCARAYLGSAARSLRGRQYVVAFSRLRAALRFGRLAKGQGGEFRRGLLRRPGAALRPQAP